MNESSWISVKDRLPCPGEILVIFDNGEHGFLLWQMCDSVTRRQVRYWMPFPTSPPKPDAFEEFWKTGEILGHRTGDRSEVRGFYGQEYCVEKRTAMMVWNAAIVACTKQSVV